jgi:carbonic anhydrase/acetyltransferase-like protein (isoleucine patch superfamily)
VIHPSAVTAEPASVRLGSDVAIKPLAVLRGHPDSDLKISNGTLIAPRARYQESHHAKRRPVKPIARWPPR